MNYLSNTNDPSAMSDATIKHVLEQAGFKVEIVDRVEKEQLTATRFS